MADLSEVILKLVENPVDVFEETIRLLLKIADNIIKDPVNRNFRTLKKENTTISNKIIKVSGAVDCLKLMGFIENDATLSLPIEVSLENIKTVRNQLAEFKSGSSQKTPTKVEKKESGTKPKTNTTSDQPVSATKSTEQPKVDQSVSTKNTTGPVDQRVSTGNSTELPLTERFKRFVLPSYTSVFTNPFLIRVERIFHLTQRYENEQIQERAKKIIPISELESTAQQVFRDVQISVKKGEIVDPEIDLQYLLILELLAWFKNSFFEWVDSPACSKCNGKTTFSHLCTDKSLLIFTDRVEMHICSACQTLTPFPRYEDLNILLETRKGRCGEWANTFTLLCRAMKWDARYVVDETDHVWTEVYSHHQKRWLHCDPCENVCDTPLIYETGWGKKVSYIMAYSTDEVQDVTWRYTCDHKAALSRRRLCSEDELVDAMMTLRKSRQESLSESKRSYLRNRLLMELVELMKEKSPSDKDQQGRLSGSLAWRTSRGESKNSAPSFIWKLNDVDVVDNKVSIQYSAAADKYSQFNGNNTPVKVVDGWEAGVFAIENMHRKEEADWKMVYLCRNENSIEGNIQWKFELNISRPLHEVIITFQHTLYETGSIEIKLENDKGVSVPIVGKSMRLNSFKDSKAVTISAKLSGGKGDVAWQHAQLFRQACDSDDYPFKVLFIFE